MQKRFYSRNTASSTAYSLRGEKMCDASNWGREGSVKTGVSCVAYCILFAIRTRLSTFSLDHFINIAQLLRVRFVEVRVWPHIAPKIFLRKTRRMGPNEVVGKWCFVISQVTNGNDARSTCEQRWEMMGSMAHHAPIYSVLLELTWNERASCDGGGDRDVGACVFVCLCVVCKWVFAVRGADTRRSNSKNEHFSFVARTKFMLDTALHTHHLMCVLS